MISNYIKIALRTLTRNKLYSVLNIAGLCFGISCFLLVGLYLFDELTFDEQHSKADRIFRVVENKTVNGDNTITAAAGYKLAEESKNQVAGIENTARMMRMGRANLVNPENPVNFQETVTTVNNSFLEIFDFSFLEGNNTTALKEPNTIIINEDLAMRLFGRKNDLLGKSLEFNFMETSLKITGVYKNLPRNSSFDFNCILSEASFISDQYFRNLAESDWLSNNFSVFVLLKPNAEPESVSKQFSALIRKNITVPAGTNFSYRLQPLKEIHLYSENIVDGARNSNVTPISKGSIYYIRIFAFVALFVLIIAGINYMNLTTARASGRLKEIGVRKSIGALRNHLMRQFLLESLLVTLIAFIFSIALVNVLLPAFNQFTGKQLSLGITTDYRIWLLAIVFAMGTGILAGSYPALMLSRFRPAFLLKGIKLHNQGDLSLRKGLVVFQFAISIVMIIGTIILVQQVRYLNTTHLGFNKDMLVVIDVNTSKARSDFAAIKSEMSAIPSIKKVSVTSRVPGEWKFLQTIKVKSQGNMEQPGISYMFAADKDFLQTFEVPLLQGRNFNSPADSSAIMINETAAKMLGITTVSGQIVEIPEVARTAGNFTPLNNQNVPFTPSIIGIVKDFHFQSLHDKIEPLILTYNYNPLQVIDYYSVRIAGTDIQGTLDKLKAIMVNNDKEEPFEYHFLDEQLALFYAEDARRQTLLIWMAFASIFIACLGLFGLATYSAEQRIKEIGVRKVLGASVLNVSSLLSKDFLKLVLIANGIAFPVAWWATNRWLQEYAYHVNVEWWVFALSGLAAVGIALLTVSFQAIRAARMNPVRSLRSE